MVSFHFPHKSIHAHWSCQIFKNPTRNPTFLQRGSNPGHVFSVRSQKGAHPACLFPSVMAEYFTEEQVSEHFGQHGLWLLVPQNVPEVMMYIIFVYRIFILHIHLFIYLFICFLIHVYIYVYNTCVHMYIYTYIYIRCIYIHVYIYTLHAFVYCVRVFVCMFKSLPLTKTMGKTPQFKNSAFVLGLLGRENWLKSIVEFITFETSLVH
jgi:hypothetical protein